MRATILFAALSLVFTLAAERSSRFVPSASGSAGVMGRYKVTLAPQFAEDWDAAITQLLSICRCRQEFYAEDGRAVFMIMATPAAARLLSSDARVALV